MISTAVLNTQGQTDESLHRLKAAAARLTRPVKFMEVCGTHTMSAFRCGLHSLMPPNVTLLSGPGCPVCVTSQRDIDQLIDLARQPGVTLCTYGDMLRVVGSNGSLEQCRAGRSGYPGGLFQPRCGEVGGVELSSPGGVCRRGF